MRKSSIRAFVALSAVTVVGAATLPAFASTVSAASFTGGVGTVSVGGTLYAKSGGALTLTVTTSSDTKCVEVSGDHTARLTSASAKSTWTFPFTAGTGDGTRTVTATASPNFNANSCTGQSQNPKPASYVVDNTGPAVSGAVSPVPNAAGWHNANASITWTATDTGSGVASGPTPATDSQTANTTGTTKNATATDRLGNVGTGTVTVKLDKAAPTITGARTPAANANGWNNSDVTVSFTCSDSVSGVKSCPGPTPLSTSAAGQSVTGTATDNADNSTSATVGGINIDKVAPSLSGAPTTSPNGNGWYKSNVTVGWTCSDALSGLTGSCPSDSSLTSEGTGLTATAIVSDKAGNSITATSTPAVKIDKTAPVTTATAPSSWNNTDVTVALTGNDGLSGVAATYFQLDGGSAQIGSSLSVSSEGDHRLDYWSVDRAGNVENVKTVQIKIDRTPPTISHTLNPLPNAAGWNNANVTVTFSCADSLSGIATCTDPQTLTTEGKDQLVTGAATDNAGNTAADPVRVSIDRTAPSITAARSPVANANGWTNTNVTVTFACGDALSGIQRCPSLQTLSEGANQSASGTASDAAGNSASTTLTGINVDLTNPTLTGAPTTAANGAGWYRGDVTVRWSCTDALSGIAGDCPTDSLVTGEGDNLSATETVLDRAGNAKTATVGGIRIDRTAPTTTAGYAAGWQTQPVVVQLSPEDGLSGVASVQATVDGEPVAVAANTVTVSADGTHVVTFWSVDKAGNAEQPTTITVQVDQEAPTIGHTLAPQPNTAGWNTSDVTVAFNCADQVSGLLDKPNGCTGSDTLTAETGGQTVTGTATDVAGNQSRDAVTVRIDKTPPKIDASRAPAANGYGWTNTPVDVSFSCSDPMSGVDVCPDSVRLGQGQGQSAQGTVRDIAGNSASAFVDDVNVDLTAPSLSGAATTSPNSNGWYKSNVTVGWTCSDALSGVDGPCPQNTTATGEGRNVSTSATVRDKAGNETSTTVDGIKIDQTAPVTGATAPSQWQQSAVTVDLSAADALSGVDQTYYTLDQGSPQTGTSVPVSGDGTHTVTYWSVDKAGNSEEPKTAQVRIDGTAPTISHTQSPNANALGWNNTDVTVTFTCTDATSGIATCTDPQTLTTEGANQPSRGSAVDNAGNTAADEALVSIDKTAPSITAARSPVANTNGWTNTNVTVTFACGDALSGIQRCPSFQTLAEGANQRVTGTASDAAGNSASTTLTGINVDLTNPTLSGAPTTAANGAGWYRGDVTVRWSCTDALSGIAGNCPTDSQVTGEGDNLTTTTNVEDQAGNTKTTTVGGIRIDRTAPTTTAGYAAGWQTQPVVVQLSPEDGLSGVASVQATVDGEPVAVAANTVTVSADGTHVVTFWSVDKAGNAEQPTTITVQVDQEAPTIGHTLAPQPNTAGWNTSDVTVAFNCADQVSGLLDKPNGCTGSDTLTAETGGQTVTGTATDVAGNQSRDAVTVRIDKTPPKIDASRAPAANGYGWTNTPVDVSFSCSDPMSGVDVCPDSVRLGQGQGQSAQGTVRDIAGNSASAFVDDVNVDLTAPSLSGAATTSPNSNGWYKSNVTVGWTCSDALSGVDGPCPQNTTATGEGRNVSTSATVRDKAGNETSTTVDGIKIDQTAPVTGATAPSQWQQSAVTVDLSAADALSGVDQTYYTLDQGSPQTGTSVPVSGDGTHTVTYWSVDKAGNSEEPKTAQVRIDGTAPTISHTQSPNANALGWNNTDVTVTFTCTDATSGIATCTDPQTLTTEGANQPSRGSAVDNAGNTAADEALVSIDKTAPSITAARSPVANTNGWTNTNVTVTFACGDALSGIQRCPSFQTLAEGANQRVTGTASDAAGNSASTTLTGINVDLTNPTLTGAPTTAANGAGWYRGDVTVRWSCTDALSGIAGNCPTDSQVTGEGDNLTTTTNVEDQAGNTKTTTVGGIRIDRTAPTLSINGVTNGGTYPLGSPPQPTCQASDALSGLAGSCTLTVTGGASNGTGTFSVTATATDRAGNTASATMTYIQVYWFDGFLQPINDTAHQVGVASSVFKAGSTVPVKFQLKKSNGTIATPTTAPVWVTPVQGTATSAPVDESVYTSSGTSGGSFRYDATAQQWIYNWDTKGFKAGYWYRIGAKLDDSTTQYVNIGLR